MDNLHFDHKNFEIFRSKLYMLEDDAWLDKGAGIPLLLKENEKDILKFESEETGGIIYEIELDHHLLFDHQEEKIFTWFNNITNIDMALSFQNEVGAETLWQKINEILASKKKRINYENENFLEEETLSIGSQSPTPERLPFAIPKEEDLQKLELDLIKAIENQTTKNLLVKFICLNNAYLDSLMNIFHNAEQAQAKNKLHILFKIFKHFIIMSHYDLYVMLLSDRYYLDVFGALEYDPDMKKKSTVSHRKYFQEHGSFKPIANIKDPDILKTIHWNFRLLFLRDYILGHHLDEKVLQFISAIIQSNYIEILQHIQTSKEVLSSLFDSLRSRDLNALKMINEICINMKNVEVDKITLFQAFNNYGLFEILEEMLIYPQPKTPNNLIKKKAKEKDFKEIDVQLHQQSILEILMLVLVQAPDMLREYCISADQRVQGYPLFEYLVEKCTTHENPTIQNMLAEGIKHLIEGGENNNRENQLQKIFYEKFLDKILTIFDEVPNEDSKENGISVAADLLTYCAKQQLGELEKCIIPLEIIEKVFNTFQTKNKFLKLMMVQLYKLLMRCEYCEIQQKLCKPLDMIIHYFVKECKARWNLLHSSILDIFNIILKEEIVILLKSVIKGNKKGFLDDPSLSDLAAKLKEKYAKLTEGEVDLVLEERKQSERSYSKNGRKPSGCFSLELSPGGNGDFNETNMMRKPSNSPKHGESPFKDQNLRRTSASLSKMDYDEEMDFNNETRGKDMNFMIEDLHVKKRKLDEVNSIKILNKTYHN